MLTSSFLLKAKLLCLIAIAMSLYNFYKHKCNTVDDAATEASGRGSTTHHDVAAYAIHPVNGQIAENLEYDGRTGDRDSHGTAIHEPVFEEEHLHLHERKCSFLGASSCMAVT
jgi:hypothetical protein